MPINSFEHYPMSWEPKLQPSHEPIYIQLAKQLENDIISGVLAPGTKLPPQRELADYLDINLSTITRAFKRCEESGLICSTVGKGTYVSSDAASKKLLLLSSLNSPDNKLIEMGAILPNPDINELVSNYLRLITVEPDFYKLLQYGNIQYDAFQIQSASKWLHYFGLESNASQLLFSNGSQNAIFALLASLFQKGERLATLPTTYPGLKIAAKILGIQLIPIPLYENKLTAASLEYVYKNHNIKGFYFIPDFNNPTAQMMDVQTRKLIGDFCNLHQIPFIEDAIYTLFMPKPYPSITSFAPDYGIFISSVSKVLSPGLRLAILHVPTRYYQKVWECLYAMHISPPALMITLFTRLVASDEFEKIRALRIAELEERNKLFDTLCPNLPAHGHIHSPIRWLELPQAASPSDFEKKALQKGLVVYSSDRFIIGSGQIPAAIRLSLISSHPIEQYKKGLSILKALYEETS